MIGQLASRALCRIGVHDWREMNGTCGRCGYEDPLWIEVGGPSIEEATRVAGAVARRLTTDRCDPRLHETRDNGMQEAYLVLPEKEREKGFVRPFRNKYVHAACGVETRMGVALSETYARDPKFYGATYCVGCGTHFPVGQFHWSDDDTVVGS